MIEKNFRKEGEVHYGSYRKASSVPITYSTAVSDTLSVAVSTCLISSSDGSLCAQNTLDSTSIQGALNQVMAEYGNRDLIYVPEQTSLPTGLSRNSMRLSSELVLVREKCSIPVAAFLSLYYGIEKYLDRTPPTEDVAKAEKMKRDVSEWTGIPIGKLKEIYECLIGYISRIVRVYACGTHPFALSS